MLLGSRRTGEASAGDHPVERESPRPDAKGRPGRVGAVPEAPRGPARQTVLTVVLEVEPRCADLLRSEIRALRVAQEKASPKFRDLLAIRSLHFLSMMVFADQRYDPILVIEANFDGRAGPFFAELELRLGGLLREMLRYCKRPADRVGAMFDGVVAAASKAPIAPLLEALSVRPAAQHQGNRGIGRYQIEQEARLFLDVRKAVKGPAVTRCESAQEIHDELRRMLRPHHPCLRSPSPRRIGAVEDIADWGGLILFAVGVIGVLHLPGVILTWISSPRWALAALIAACVALGVILRAQMRNDPAGRRPSTAPNGDAKGSTPLDLIALVGVPLLTAEAVVGALVAGLRTLLGRPDPFWTIAATTGLGALGAVATVLAVAIYLRHLEKRDPSQRAPPVDPRADREITALEDRLPRNHMGSLVHLKPGLLRAILARLGLTGLGLVMRVEGRARHGYLVTVRTIHFAHLALVSNRSRLLFLSNFDGTWDNYLTDFIEKVHIPLTVVWNSGVGFPPTRYFFLDGATQGRLFKNWKRRSMAPNLLWFNAYPELSVEQIERQARIAEGLRKAKLKPREAARWALDL